MRRLIRILGRVGIGISLLLGVSVLVLWAWSYSGGHLALWIRTWREEEGASRKLVQVISRSGRIYLLMSWTQMPGRRSLCWEEFMGEAQRTGGRPEFRVTRLVHEPWDE